MKDLGLVGGPGEGGSLSHQKQLQLSPQSAPQPLSLVRGSKAESHWVHRSCSRASEETGNEELGAAWSGEESGLKGLSPFTEQSGPASNRLSYHKVHYGLRTQARQTPSPTWSTFHSPTPVGVCRHVLLLPINNSRWLCKPRGKVLVNVDMQFDLLLSGGKTRKEWHPLQENEDSVHVGSSSLGWGLSAHQCPIFCAPSPKEKTTAASTSLTPSSGQKSSAVLSSPHPRTPPHPQEG